jgi:hypothetical protein
VGSIQSPRGGESRGRTFFSRGIEMRCYTCGKIGHMSWDCPENKATNQRNTLIAEKKEEDVNAVAKEETLEVWESMLLNEVLVMVENEVHEPTQRKSLFGIVCKSRGK